MSRITEILARAVREPHALTRDELALLLAQRDPGAQREIYAAAYEVKVRHVGRVVSLRGIVEMGNVCAKNCFYCGIRRDNRVLERYQLDEPEILEAVQRNIALQYGSIVLQSGEIESEAHTLFIEQLLRKITAMTDGTLGITLSLGEQTADTFRRWRSAGAHRYLLRIETSNPRLYARFHPADHSLERRRECLRHLRTYDYQVGSGVMSGLPGQTCGDLADDILFFHEMDVDMIGMGPYIPHHDTPLGRDIPFTKEYAASHLNIGLNVIAATRLYLHNVNIAATTALHALADDGREQGVLAGANVIMPNVSDVAYRRRYQLYENKPAFDERAEESRDELARRLQGIGETINWNKRGDSPRYAARKLVSGE